MFFKSISSFLRGLFEKEGNESRIADGTLTKLLNVDIDNTGKLIRRRGYQYWNDLLDDNSASDGTPNVITRTGFPHKIQAIKEWTDVGGNKYIFIVSNGKIYTEVLDEESNKIWICLNPSGNIDLTELQKHIKITSYLDVIFFNDLANNVLMYNSNLYTGSGWSKAAAKFIYWAGDKIYFRSYTDYYPDWHEWDLTVIDEINKKFTVAGDQLSYVEQYDKIEIQGSDNNDGVFTVVGVTKPAADTVVEVSEAVVAEAPAKGKLKSPYRIKIEDKAVNSEGKAIYDGLVAINYIGGGFPAPTTADLNFGYCLRVGNQLEGYYYFVLGNSKNQTAADECYIVKFNDRFIAQDYIALDMDSNGDILNFEYYDDNLYIFCEDGKIIKILADDFSFIILNNSNGIGGLSGVVVDSGKKQYSLCVNENGIFVYSTTLPNKSDWYQPIICKKDFDFESSFSSSTPPASSSGENWDDGIKHTPTTLKGVLNLASTESNKHQYLEFTSIQKKAGWDSGLQRFELLYGYYVWWDIGLNWYRENELILANFRKHIDNNDISADTHLFEASGDNGFEYAPKRHVRAGYYTNGFLPYSVESSWRDTCKQLTFTQYNKEIWFWFQNDTVRWNRLIRALKNSVNGKIIVSGSAHNDGTYTISSWSYSCQISHSICIYTSENLQNETLFNGDTDVINIYYCSWRDFKNVNFINQKAIYENKFQYDKENNAPTNEQIFYKGNYEIFRKDNTLYLFNTNFNSKFFINITTSKYALMVGLNLDGTLKEKSFTTLDEGNKNWRHILPCGLINDIKDLLPLQIKDKELYFGSSMEQYSEEDKGIYIKFNIDTLNYENKVCNTSCRKVLINSDISSRWLLRGNPDFTGHNAKFRIGMNWDYQTGGNIFDNFMHLLNYNANLLYHIQKQIGKLEDQIVDKIQYLGTGKIPFVTIIPISSGNFLLNTKLKYQIAFQFYSIQTTYLSPESEELIIPQLHSPQTFTADHTTERFTANAHGYVVDDIVRVSSDNTLPAGLSVDIDYYILLIDVNIFQLSLTAGGAAVAITDNGTGTHSIIQSNKQPVKIVITSINLLNILGNPLYQKSDVEKIQIYRKQKNPGEEWTEPLLLAVMEKGDDILKGGDDQDWYYYTDPTTTPYDKETYEDSIQDVAYNPFTYQNVLKYPINDFVVHKARLILINKLDYENSNVLHYSSVDLAEALPPGNVRAVESGDGDYLVAGVSVRDYLYLFKSHKIYAILGDVYNGQLLDINKIIGTKYRNLIAQFNDMIYFINDEGIYRVAGVQTQDVMQERIKNYFDKLRNDCIDFENLDAQGYVYVDKEKKEVKWHVPQKQDGISQTQNNLCIIYNIQFNYFKTYSYNADTFIEEQVKDIASGELKTLLTDYSGNIYEITKDKNDDGKGIKYIVRTKELNMDSNLLAKSYKIIKLFGTFLSSLKITYWIDGKRMLGKIIYRANENRKGEALVPIWSRGRCNTIVIEIGGEDANDIPFEVEEILIGIEKMRSIR